MRKAHLKKRKLFKQQAAKGAASGRGGGGSGKKQAFSWKYVANIEGEGLTLGGVWTRGEAAKHFDLAYKSENDNPRGGNVSINSEVYTCCKYIANSGDNERVYVRIVEMAEGTHYKIEQGYPLCDGDGDDDEDGVTGAPSKVAHRSSRHASRRTCDCSAQRSCAACRRITNAQTFPSECCECRLSHLLSH